MLGLGRASDLLLGLWARVPDVLVDEIWALDLHKLFNSDHTSLRREEQIDRPMHCQHALDSGWLGIPRGALKGVLARGLLKRQAQR